MDWDGRTERRGSPDDHDKLTRLLVSVENHVRNFEQHTEEDKVNFGNVNIKVEKHAMYIYMGLGAVALLNILLSMKH